MDANPPTSDESRAAHRELAWSALESTEDYLEGFRESLERTAANLRTGYVDTAVEVYSLLLDGLEVVVFSLNAAGEQLGEEASGLREVPGEAARVTAALVTPQENRDWIGLADVLEHELRPLLDVWSSRIRALRSKEG